MAEKTNEEEVEIIKEKRTFLRFLCRAVQLVGWILVVAGVVFTLSVFGSSVLRGSFVA